MLKHWKIYLKRPTPDEQALFDIAQRMAFNKSKQNGQNTEAMQQECDALKARVKAATSPEINPMREVYVWDDATRKGTNMASYSDSDATYDEVRALYIEADQEMDRGR